MPWLGERQAPRLGPPRDLLGVGPPATLGPVAALTEVMRRFLVAEEEATARLAATWTAAQADVQALLARAVAEGVSPSDVAYYRALEQQVAAITTRAAAQSAAWVNTTTATAYVEGALTAHADMAFAAVNDNAVRAASTYTAGLITRVGVEMQNAVHMGVLQAVAGSWSPQRLEAAILATGLQRGPWRSAAQRAAVVARTETMRAYNAGAIAGIRQAGTDKVEWIDTEDERVCPICSERDGQVYPADQVAIPAHPRCRCIVTAWWPDVGAVKEGTPPAGGPTEQAPFLPGRAVFDALAPQQRASLLDGLGPANREWVEAAIARGEMTWDDVVRLERYDDWYDTTRRLGLGKVRPDVQDAVARTTLAGAEADDALLAYYGETTADMVERFGAGTNGLSAWTNGPYGTINGHFRYGKALTDKALQQSADGLDAAMARTSLPVDVQVTRAVSWSRDRPPFPVADIDQLPALIGREFRDDGFMATTPGRLSGQFADPALYPIRLEVTVPRGTRALRTEPYNRHGEGELLLDRGTTVSVVDVVRSVEVVDGKERVVWTIRGVVTGQ
jgi:SPP1 gp7 family putative phage head morphogenesis protein